MVKKASWHISITWALWQQLGGWLLIFLSDHCYGTSMAFPTDSLGKGQSELGRETGIAQVYRINKNPKCSRKNKNDLCSVCC